MINQQIALELLGHSGAQVEIAGGGIEGVSMALNARQAHDAILMDMQMPDIDGLEATRRIRAEPQMLGVPIIAMTANALDSDKEACRAVGMVDHVSKPIDLKVLIDTLLRHVTKPVHAPFEAVANEVAVSPAPTCGAISSSLLDIDTAVARLGGMREFYDQVLRSFRADAPLQLNEVSHYLAQDKWGDAVRCAHTLKGLASTIGATRLAQAGAELESMLKQPDRATDELDASLRQIRVLLSAVLTKWRDLSLSCLMSTVVHPPPPPCRSRLSQPRRCWTKPPFIGPWMSSERSCRRAICTRSPSAHRSSRIMAQHSRRRRPPSCKPLTPR
ncbi:MAG: response regulator [Rhodocyclaceae bacterium]|nr:response regulator [Rhodocyclaceae bacterium]